jgi:hypothetical protein
VEFLSLNNIPIDLAEKFAQRVNELWSIEFSEFSYSYICLSETESQLALLIRLDEAEVMRVER